jgi:XTP/dITP diphosphohydrolase
MARASAAGRVVLVETSEALPGLLPFQAWDALAAVDRVHLRDPATHPSAPHLHLAGLDLVTLEPAALDRGDLDLTRPGGPEDRRLAKALVAAAREHGSITYLLDPAEAGLAPALAGMVAEHDVEIELVLLAQLPPGTELLRSVTVMDRLRDPDGGCPWDLEQDHESLARYLVEETYELLDAIAGGEDDDVREELGDVLLQVLFHARIAAERRAFGIDDVARGLVDKLVRRHPHVFADGTAETADDVQRAWDRLKAEERGGRGPFDGVPRAMPGLALLDALLRRGRRLGMLPEDGRAIADELVATAERLVGLTSDGEGVTPALEEVLGTLIVQAVALARTVGLEADGLARSAGVRWRERADAVVALAAERAIEVSELETAVRRSGWPSVARAAQGGGRA